MARSGWACVAVVALVLSGCADDRPAPAGPSSAASRAAQITQMLSYLESG
jgi:hypothetical protein